MRIRCIPVQNSWRICQKPAKRHQNQSKQHEFQMFCRLSTSGNSVLKKWGWNSLDAISLSRKLPGESAMRTLHTIKCAGYWCWRKEVKRKIGINVLRKKRFLVFFRQPYQYVRVDINLKVNDFSMLLLLLLFLWFSGKAIHVGRHRSGKAEKIRIAWNDDEVCNFILRVGSFELHECFDLNKLLKVLTWVEVILIFFYWICMKIGSLSWNFWACAWKWL